MITAIIPLYNKERHIIRAVKSAMDSSVSEVIVVDDGSTDTGASLVEAAAQEDPRIRLIKQANAGVSAARNTGISAASSPWVAFLDADDEWTPSHIPELMRLIASYPAAAFVATSYVRRFPDGLEADPTCEGVPEGGGLIHDFFGSYCAEDRPYNTSTFAVRREKALKIGGFPEGVTYCEDRIFCMRLSRLGPVAWSPEVGGIYHVGTDNQSLSGWTPACAEPAFQELLAVLAEAPEWERASIRAAMIIDRRVHFQNSLEVGRSAFALRWLPWLLLRDDPLTSITNTIPRLLLPRPLRNRVRGLVRRRRLRTAT